MQSGWKIPVRLLVFLYLISVLDPCGEVTIGVVCKAGENIMIVSHRCNVHTLLSVISLLRVVNLIVSF